MPTTTFMQRDARHDHGFTIPDPALNAAAGVPDACTGCHTEEGAEWAAAQVEAWLGPGRRRSRERAAVLAAALPEAAALLPIAKSDPHPYWRGTALSLLAELPWGSEVLRASTRDAAPIVRLRALGALSARPRSEELERVFRHALADPLRAVRVQAARGLRRSLDPESPEAEPLRTWLEANLGQPEGARDLGAWQLERGRPAEALLHLQRAAVWDPADVQAKLFLAFANLRLGRRAEAATSLVDCIRVAPQLAEARLALARLQQEEGDVAAGVDTLERGERAIPTDPRLPRALARAYAEQGLDAAARRAEDRARKLEAR